MSTDRARPAAPPSRHRQLERRLLGALCTAALGCALAAAAAPTAGQALFKPRLAGHAAAGRESKEPFGPIPKGPLQIVISVDQQKLHLYSDGMHVADTPVATGVPSHPTPLGIFSVIQKSRYHRSNIYSGAPMPYMQRITWSGVAIHEGVGVGHPASHGCIRMPHEFATRLWALTKLGARVIIVRSEVRPEEFADTHLFVHEEQPAAPATTPLKTAQSAGTATTDAAHTDRNSASDSAVGRDAADPPAAVDAAQTNAPGDAGPATETVPEPPPKPAKIARASGVAPITIFVSRKNRTIYVRQDFSPLFHAPIAIEHPDQRLGTYVFTALDYLNDHATLRWNLIAVPDEEAKRAQQAKHRRERDAARSGRSERIARPSSDAALHDARAALARVEIPQDTIEQISQLIVPGSSLIVSDQGLGEETGEGTDFIVVTH